MSPKDLLCADCLQQIEWINPQERCVHCFAPAPCRLCKTSPRPLRPHRSVFEGVGPVRSLYDDFLRTKRADPLASLLLLAWTRASFPCPDAIVPATLKIFPQQDPAYLLAKAVSRLLRCPLLLPRASLQDKSLLLITPILQNLDETLDIKNALRGAFPRSLYSLALIDLRT
ncbi:MAG: hypothetical protein KDK64_00620 [Chlamydiia bacterium]|nr:hypothetical protein [Chlamydiia bacterium]